MSVMTLNIMNFVISLEKNITSAYKIFNIEGVDFYSSNRDRTFLRNVHLDR